MSPCPNSHWSSHPETIICPSVIAVCCLLYSYKLIFLCGKAKVSNKNCRPQCNLFYLLCQSFTEMAFLRILIKFTLSFTWHNSYTVLIKIKTKLAWQLSVYTTTNNKYDWNPFSSFKDKTWRHTYRQNTVNAQ